jgi:hypothetical protein
VLRILYRGKKANPAANVREVSEQWEEEWRIENKE